MKYLITNSDDFGLTRSITDAIIDTHINGIMTSTTLMANMEGTDYAIQKAKEISTLGVGIHFNLTEGKPLTEQYKIPLLLNNLGEFNNNAAQRKNFLFGKEKQKQAELELSNQLSYLIDNGVIPTHFDSHHHITGTPVAFMASMNVAKKYQINRARITNIDILYSDDYFGGIGSKFKRRIIAFPKMLIHQSNKNILRANNFRTPDTKILPSRVLPLESSYINQFIKSLSVLRDGVTEISFHPGYANSYPKDSDKTSALRLRDLEIANSKKVMEFIKNQNIQLISFKDL
jgi:hypothetical protein